MSRIYINDNWLFTEKFSDEFLNGMAEGQSVRLPHNCRDLAFNYCDNREYQMICGYRRIINVPAQWLQKRVLLTFGAAGHKAQIYINGEEVFEHACGYTAFTVELTGKLHEGENVIAVCLDTNETLDQPPFGFVIDYLTYGGLYREVWLEVKEQSFIADAFVHSTPVPCVRKKTADNSWTLTAELAVAGKAALSSDAELCAVICDADGNEISAAKKAVSEADICTRALPESLAFRHDECLQVQLSLPVSEPKLWSVDEPNMYSVHVTLYNGGSEADSICIDTGFRTAEFRADGFYLNGEKLKLRGLNRHQSMPYIGYAMPASLQRFDAQVLKEELGVNTVRTSHYPQSHHFIDCCDRIGLLVFTEIPGWQHIGGEEWQNRAVCNVDEMVAQYRNHPSIILWGVRINESQDNDALYIRTNAAAHALDDTRPTSGVRNIEKSSLLEDVYAHNDFSYTGKEDVALKPKKRVTPDRKKSYFVSEYNGHMFPTKIYDDEEHCLAHALRHANVLKAMYASEDIGGCIGWCMFDYNTHIDFGSGDRICYHGVTDMFRNPKIAAAAYASQSDIRPVCEISSSMLIGEHPGGAIGDVYAFTNADSVKLYKNESFVAEFFPDRKAYPNMPHPPIKIDDFIGCLLEKNEGFSKKIAAEIKFCLADIAKNGPEGMSLRTKLKLVRLIAATGLTMEDGISLYGKYIGNWGGTMPEYRFEAWKDGEVSANIVKAPPCRVTITAQASAVDLIDGDSYDAAVVRITAVDENGKRLPYFNEPVLLSTEGAIELIGPSITALRGGAGGTLIRTIGRFGSGRLTVEVPGHNKATVDFNIKCEK